MKKRIIALVVLMAMVIGMTSQLVSATESDAYQVGYAKVDINPYADGTGASQELLAIPMAGGAQTKTRLSTTKVDDNGDGVVDANDGLFATCTAITDVDGNTVLVITADLCNSYTVYAEAARQAILDKHADKGVTADRILINASHNHSGPMLVSSWESGYDFSDDLKAYRERLVSQLVAAADAALANRAPATMTKGSIDASQYGATHTTVGDTLNSIKTTGSQLTTTTAADRIYNTVRHYVITATGADGSTYTYVAGDNFNKTYDLGATFTVDGVKYTVTDRSTVTQADDVMQVVKFTFANGADPIAMVNWRAHMAIYDKGGDAYYHITSDYANSLRYVLEQNNYRAVFLQGASGNINTGTKLPGGEWLSQTAHKTTDGRYGNKHLIYGTELAEVALEALANNCTTEVAVGEIRSSQYNYEAARKNVSVFEYMAGKLYQEEYNSTTGGISANRTYGADQMYYWLDESGNPMVYTNESSEVKNKTRTEAKRYTNDDGSDIEGVTKVVAEHSVTVASIFHANSLVDEYRSNGEAGVDIELNAVTIGDFALVTSAGEPFDYYDDGNGENLWDTVNADFILGYTNIGGGYLSSAMTYSFNEDMEGMATGSYETMCNSIGQGTGEGIVNTLADMMATLRAAQPESTEGYCAHCRKTVSWTALGSAVTTNILSGGHYTVTDETLEGITALEGAKICIDLGGNTLSVKKGFDVSYGAELTFLGEGAVEGDDAVVEEDGGVFRVAKGGTLNLYRATLRYVGATGTHGVCNSVSQRNDRIIRGGGIIYLQGTFNMYGGKVLGTNTYASGGAILIDSNGRANVYGGEIRDKSTSQAYNAGGLGDCIRACGQILLANDAKVDSIFFHGQTENTNVPWNERLLIDGKYTGYTKLQYGTFDISALNHTAAVTDGIVFEQNVGKAINGGDISRANITVDNTQTVNSETVVYAPQVINGYINLQPRTTFIGEVAEGNYVYGNFDEVVAAVPEGGTVIVQADPKQDLTVSKNLNLELKGNSITGTVTVNNDVTLTVSDNMTADYDVTDGKYGKIKTAGVGTTVGAPATETSDVYLVFDEGNGYTSYHAVALNIDGMSLNTEKQGMYFVHTFKGDAIVKAVVDTYGVALKLESTPTEEELQADASELSPNILKSGDVVYTSYAGTSFGNLEATSTLVSGIMKTTNGYLTNKRNASMQICGKAYIKMKNSDTVVLGVERSRSLQEQYEGIDETLWSTYNQEQRNAILKVYETKAYKQVMDEWTIPNITTQQQAADEQEVLRILAIGNSHTDDCTHMLREVFAQEEPGRKVMVSNMYYSGCSVERHVMYEKNNTAAYAFRKNSEGTWSTQSNTTLQTALEDQVWDVIMLHEMNRNVIQTSTYTNTNLQTHINYVKENTVGTPTIMWNFSWANPVDEYFFTQENSPLSLEALASWRKNYVQVSRLNYNTMLSQMAEMTQRYVIKNKNISAVAPTGTAICYARNVKGLTDLDLYRDYTHTSDYGRLISAYVWYATITGKTEITEVNVDEIPGHLRFGYTAANKLSAVEVTPEMKEVIKDSVNFALKNPWTVSTGN